MNYKQLMEQPDGIIFYEDDLPEPPLFRKLATVDDDIRVEGIATTDQFCLGLKGMTATEKNSLRYKIWDGYIVSERENEFAEVIELREGTK